MDWSEFMNHLAPLLPKVALFSGALGFLSRWMNGGRRLVSHWSRPVPFELWAKRNSPAAYDIPENISPTAKLWVTPLTIVNAGSEPLKNEDYETHTAPVLRAIGASVRLYRCERTNDLILTEIVTTNGSKQGDQFPAVLWNPGDWVELWVITEGKPNRLWFSARIAGAMVEDAHRLFLGADMRYCVAIALLALGAVVFRLMPLWPSSSVLLRLTVVGATLLASSAWFLGRWVWDAIPLYKALWKARPGALKAKNLG